MEKYIHITKEVREHLKKTYHVSGMTLWKALYYKSTSDLANRIRKDALEHYGIVMAFFFVLLFFFVFAPVPSQRGDAGIRLDQRRRGRVLQRA